MNGDATVPRKPSRLPWDSQVASLRDAMRHVAERVSGVYGPLHWGCRPVDLAWLAEEPVPRSAGDQLRLLARVIDDRVGDGRKTGVLIAATAVATALTEA